MISREYAEFIAARFDSLEHFKKYESKLLTCDSLLYKAESLIIDLQKQQYTLSDMLLLKDAIIKSHERDIVVYKDISKQLKKEKRLKKVWKISTYTFITVSLGAITYSIFK